MVIKDGAKMSKTKGNVVERRRDGRAVRRRHGRVFGCSPRRPRRTWTGSTPEREGQSPLPRPRLPLRHAQCRSARTRPASATEADRRVLRKLHQTIRKITDDFETLALQHLDRRDDGADQHAGRARSGTDRSAAAEILEKLCLMLHPFAPFLSQEIWSVELGREGYLIRQPWPAVNAELAKEDGAEIPIQVNGKLRSKIVVPFGIAKDELERLVLADEKTKSNIAGKQVVKIVIVPDKLVNIVVKG